MATRANEDLKNALVKTYTVAASQTATLGLVVVLSGADDTIDDAGANVLGIGVALETAVAGARCQVAMLAGSAQIRVKVGTGGATRGSMLKTATDGVTDTGTLGGGTTLVQVVGMALQSGVAGDFIAMLPCPHSSVSA